MKIILTVLLLAGSAFGQMDACKESTIKLSGGAVITNRKILKGGVNSTDVITEFIRNEFVKKENSNFPNLIIEIPAGKYTSEKGILIDRDLIGEKGICLSGKDKPVLQRTRFNNEEYEPSVIKISGVSNVVVRGFELIGTISRDNRGFGLAGVSIVNFNDGKEITNLSIEDNLVHSIGQYYDYDNKDGYWRYKNDDRKDISNEQKCTESKPVIADTKVSCGQAHGIYVASNKNPVSHIKITGNTLKNLRLGESEAITVGERVFDFNVSCNTIFDVDNIGIDIAGKQDGIYQSTQGTVSGNKIYGLKGAAELKGENDAYPFVAGIYVDGGTGSSWEESIRIVDNTVSEFGIGISIGSENKYCNFCNYCKAHPAEEDCKEFCEPDKCKTKVCCSKVKVQYILIEKNVLKDNQLYGIGIGKDTADQNSQTWYVKVIGNTIVGNVLSTVQGHSGYSQLHFGSLEPDSLKEIEIRGNTIKATGNNSLLVAVKPSEGPKHLIPSVSFYKNIFYADQVTTPIWIWGISDKQEKSYAKSDLVNPQTNLLTLPTQIAGSENLWKAGK
jgi:hypothetical protein